MTSTITTGYGMLGVGEALSSQVSYDKAIECFQEVLRLDARNPQAHAGLGHAKLGLGQITGESKYFTEAVGHYTEAIELKPDHLRAYEGKARAHEALGEREAAEESLRMAQRLWERD